MIFDAVVIAALLVSALIAVLRGFIREILTIVGVVGGIAAAYLLGPLAAPFVRGWFGIEEGGDPEDIERLFGIVPYTLVADGLTYGAIFILVVIVLSIASHMLSETAKEYGLGLIDRSLGFAFGVVRAVILLSLLYLPVHLFAEKETKEEWFKDSHTHVYVEWTAGLMAGVLPKELEEKSEKVTGSKDLMEDTRKRLQEMEILREGDEEEVKEALRDEVDKIDRKAAEIGYTEEEREKLRDMIGVDEFLEEDEEDAERREDGKSLGR